MQTPKRSFPKRVIVLSLIAITVSTVIILFATPKPTDPPGGKPDGAFQVSANPASLLIPRVSLGNSTVTLTSVSGFTGDVNLSTVFVGSGLAVALSPVVLTLTAGGTGASFLTISVGSSTQVGQYNVTIMGSSGATSASTTVYLTAQ